jgi:CheY-like chemotaxis protein
MSNVESRPELVDTRVMVVEDNEEHRYLLAAHLEKAGCTVTSTGSAEEAIANYAETLPHIVFTDVQLPGMSGFEFVAWLQKQGLPIPRIVTTSVLDPSDHPSADAALAKPFSRSHVQRVLDDYLAVRNS